MNQNSIEWNWDNSPILLPLAYERREWNSIYVAFFLGEYCGAPVRILHVKTEDRHINKEDFLKEIFLFAKELNINLTIEDIEISKKNPSRTDIANTITEKASKYNCQAIIMSAHKEDLFVRIIGRISDNVARKARCKVVLVESPWAGLNIPRHPRRILIPVLDVLDNNPFIIAAALTSSASIATAEIITAKIVKLPPTIPLDAIEISATLRLMEQEFSNWIGDCIQSLGRLFTPKIIPVRDIGSELSDYVTEIGADLMIISGVKRGRLRSLLGRQEYEIVKKSPCVILMVFSQQK